MLTLTLTLAVLALLIARCQELRPAAAAQETRAQVIKALADGSFVVEINGQQYRALTNAQLDEQQKTFDHLTNKLSACRDDQKFANDEMIKFGQTVEILRRDLGIAQRDIRIEHLSFVNAMSMYDGEKKLREQAETFIPRGRVNNFFQKPAVMIFKEFGVKGIDWWLSSRNNNNRQPCR